MKIVILVPFFPPVDLNGSEIAAYNIAKNLSLNNHEVHVITSWDKGLPKEIFEDGFYIHRIKTSRCLLTCIILYTQSLLIIKRLKPDIIHAQGIFLAGFSALLSKKLLGISYIAYGRGSDIYLDNGFVGYIEKRCSSHILRDGLIIVLTEDMRRKVLELWNQNSIIIPNGVDLKRFGSISKDQAREELSIAKDEKVIIFIGSVRKVKGVKYLIESMNNIREKNPLARLLIVGNIEHDGKILCEQVAKLECADYINFIGKTSIEMIPIFMAASDIFVLPSLSEGFPLVILEAMACGLPIVATKVGGIPEIVKDKENGFLIDPKSPMQISEKVCLLLDNEQLRKRIFIENKNRAKKFGWDAVCNRLEEIYKLAMD